MPIHPSHSGTTAFRSFSAIFGGSIHRAAKLSSRNPIEMVVVVLILASLCYFYLFNLARTSDIFSGTVTRLYPTFAYASSGDATQFTQLDRGDPLLPQHENDAVKIHLKQIVISDPHHGNDVLTHQTLSSVLRFQRFIENEIYVPSDSVKRFAFNRDLCYKTSDQCFVQSPLDFWQNDEAVLRKDTDLAQTLAQQHPDLAQAVFGDLVLQHNNNKAAAAAQSVILSYAFNATGSYRQRLADLWEHKVATLAPGDLVSLSSSGHQENIFSWLFIIVRNVVIRINELISVSCICD